MNCERKVPKFVIIASGVLTQEYSYSSDMITMDQSSLQNAHSPSLYCFHEQVLSEKFIFIADETIVNAYKGCNMVVGEESFYPSPYGFVFPEDSPYVPIFNDA